MDCSEMIKRLKDLRVKPNDNVMVLEKRIEGEERYIYDGAFVQFGGITVILDDVTCKKGVNGLSEYMEQVKIELYNIDEIHKVKWHKNERWILWCEQS